MKYVFIEKHQAEFSMKATCRVLQVARSGWYVWHQHRHQINQRQQFCLVCDNVVREAFSDTKQRYGAPRLTDVSDWCITYKPWRPACAGRDCGRKPPAGSAWSVIMSLVCQYQIIC